MTRRAEPGAPAGEPLVCVACAATAPAAERFCPDCGTPLVFAPGTGDGGPPPSAQSERARKVRPQYGEGPLVRVAAARHQAEAELLQGLLLEEGIPSLMRRTGGFDVPDFLAAGPRDILVPASGEAAARDLLGTTPAPSGVTGVPGERRLAAPWVRALAVALAVLLLASTAAGVMAAVF